MEINLESMLDRIWVNVMQLPREPRDFDPVSFLKLDQCWTSVYGADSTLI